MPSLETDVDAAQPRTRLINSSGSDDELRILDPMEAAQLMPVQLRRLLFFGGGSTGNEHPLCKSVLLVCSVLHMLIVTFVLWLLGVSAMPDCVAFFTGGCFLLGGNLMIRWHFLQSGILWSLAKVIDVDGKIMSSCNSECQALLKSSPIQAVLVFGGMTLIAFRMNVDDRVDSLGDVGRASGLAACVLDIIFVLNVVQYSFKAMPMLFTLTCDLLVEDMRNFHHKIHSLLANCNGTESARTGLLEELQQHEGTLRTRLVAANRILGPNIGCLTFITVSVAFSFIILAVMNIKWGSYGLPALIAFYIFPSGIFLTLAVVLLCSTARVGDRWAQLMDDLTTLLLRVHSTASSGASLSECLWLLENTGIHFCGFPVTSQNLTKVAVTMGATLFLIILGAVLAT